MKKAKPGNTFFFVDESGDPTFYDRRGNLIVGSSGCSPLLILGLIKIEDPIPVRKTITQLNASIVNDPFFADFPSIKKTKIAFHAKDDLPEIRFLFFKEIQKMEFKAKFIIARKIDKVFKNNFSSNENKFYDHLVTQLFMSELHLHEQNLVYFAKRGSHNRQVPIEKAITTSISNFENKWHKQITTKTVVQAQSPAGEPCLSIVDYMNWAVYRAYTRNEIRYFNLVRDKVDLLVDLYDHEHYPGNWFNKKNPFELNKITPL